MGDMELQKYYGLLVQNGYDSLKALQYIDSIDELKDIGIVARGHQKFLFGEIKKLKAKPTPQGNTIVNTDNMFHHPNQLNTLIKSVEGTGINNGYTTNKNDHFP